MSEEAKAQMNRNRLLVLIGVLVCGGFLLLVCCIIGGVSTYISTMRE